MESLVKDRTRIQASESRVQPFKIFYDDLFLRASFVFALYQNLKAG